MTTTKLILRETSAFRRREPPTHGENYSLVQVVKDHGA